MFFHCRLLHLFCINSCRYVQGLVMLVKLLWFYPHGYAFSSITDQMLMLKAWLKFLNCANFCFAAFPKILFFAAFLLLLSFWYVFLFCFYNILNLSEILLFECEQSLEFMHFPLNHGCNSQLFKLIYRCIFHLKGFSKGKRNDRQYQQHFVAKILDGNYEQ